MMYSQGSLPPKDKRFIKIEKCFFNEAGRF